MVTKTILGDGKRILGLDGKKNFGIRVANFFEVGTIFLGHGVTILSGGEARKFRELQQKKLRVTKI